MLKSVRKKENLISKSVSLTQNILVDWLQWVNKKYLELWKEVFVETPLKIPKSKLEESFGNAIAD